MPSERVQRQIDRLLDEAEQAIGDGDWARGQQLAQRVLTIDPENEDAGALLAAANRGLASSSPLPEGEGPPEGAVDRLGIASAPPRPLPSAPLQGEGTESAGAVPASFAAGRYQVKRFLGEGGKKRVYLAHDTLLDRDVAFALIKTEGLDLAGRDRIRREAQAMGRLGSHPNIVSVFDLGEEPLPKVESPGLPSPSPRGGGDRGEVHTQPFIVTELMGGGDVEGLIEKAPDHRPPLGRSLEIGIQVCRGLEFAHAHGIVHRDLKPGNVWLTSPPAPLRVGEGSDEAGVAKLGDFGLAVALDRSRLTQAGMMVGTVAYMPPEQALGGEVTPRSDLYSLGAMLYEMVTGRPPYVGEESIAIITQHLNTAPVAPSWHNATVPPALELLILRLLEKAPAKRPASAAEAGEALEAIDPAAPVAATTGNPLERVARGVFVGREQELRRLQGAIDAAVAGGGGVVMLVGEPGIGKTRTAQELETYARIRGGQVLWGRAHESAGAPAYWPWVQALRAYVAVTDPAALRSQLGSGATEVARVVSELRERLPGLPEATAIVEPESAQFRLFDAIASFLKNASTAAPLLIVLDDLHWADKPSLLLLQHLAREIGRSRLLVLGTYRDVEVGRAHPLAETLAELAREQLFQRVLLRGLSREEVDAYIKSSAGVDPARELLAAIYEETEGNPFFLGEVVALMTQEGTLAGGRKPLSASERGWGEVTVPQSVREVLGRRLDRLSSECNELLTVAAVAGREFRYELLGAVRPLPRPLSDAERGDEDEGLLVLVEEALAARVIEEAGAAGEYRFSHALIQETLLGELSTTRRVRLHGRIAEALERLYGERAERQAAELAQHYAESATLTRAHAGKAARYSRLAGEQAEAAFGWEEAARWYGGSLTTLRDTGENLGEDEAALLLGVGRCRIRSGYLIESLDPLHEAASIYRAREDGAGMARAVLAMWVLFGASEGQELRGNLIDEALTLLGAADPHLRAELLERRARLAELDESGRSAAGEARSLALERGFADVQALLLDHDALRAGSALRLLESERVFRQAAAGLSAAGRQVDAAFSLALAAQMPLLLGDLEAGEARLDEAMDLAQRANLPGAQNPMLAARAGIALARGEFDQFQELTGRAFVFRTGTFHHILRARRAELAGDLERASAVLEDIEVFASRGAPLGAVRAIRARIALSAGDETVARRALLEWRDQFLRPTPRTWDIDLRVAVLVGGDEVVAALAEEEVVREVYAELVACAPIRFHPRMATSIDCVRGRLALRLGLIDEAEAHYRTGLEWTERERCVIDQGRCLQGLAEVAELRGQHAEAMKLLDRAAAIFQQYGINLYLKQVLAKKEILKA